MNNGKERGTKLLRGKEGMDNNPFSFVGIVVVHGSRIDADEVL